MVKYKKSKIPNDRLTIRDLEWIYDTEEKCLWFFTQLLFAGDVASQKQGKFYHEKTMESIQL